MHNLSYTQQIFFKISSVNDINKIDSVFKELTSQSPFRMAGRLKYIMSLFTGTSKSPGLIPLLIEQSFSKNPHQWIDKMEKVISLIGPKSAYVQALKKNSNLRVSIQKNILPPQLNSQTKHLYEPFVNMVEDTDGISLSAIDWYYTTLVCAIYSDNSSYFSSSSTASSIAMKSLPITSNKVAPSVAFDQDDFFFILARNPWFVLLRKHLEQEKEKSEARRKIISLIKAYFVDPLLMKYSTNQIGKSTDLKSTRLSYSQSIGMNSYSFRSFDFLLKVNGILSVFLALVFPCTNQYRNSNSQYNGNISTNIKNNLQDYFLLSIQNFHAITSYRNNEEQSIVLRFLIRTWLLFMRPNDTVEKKMVDNLKNANSKDGWLNVKKYLPKQIVDDSNNSNKISNYLFKSFDIKDYQNFEKIVEGFINLFKNTNHWTASIQYFHTLSVFLAFLKINASQIKKIQSQQGHAQNQFKNRTNSLPIGITYQQSQQNGRKTFIYKNVEALQKVAEKFQKVISEAVSIESTRLSQRDFIHFYDRLHTCIDYFYDGLQTVYQIKSDFCLYSLEDLIKKGKNRTKSQQSPKQFRSQRIVSYYASYGKNPWEAPLSEYESYILRGLIYPVAKGLHYLTPEKYRGEYPLNIRFLTNPYSLLIIILLFTFVFNWIFGTELESVNDVTK